MNNLISNSFPGGNTWTLTTRALKYLLEAEERFGPRTTEFLYGGVEVTTDEKPHIYFLFDKYVIIRLTSGTTDNINQAIFQISHEIIHVLSPLMQPTTNNLEEGLASYYSNIVTSRDTNDPNYALNAIRITKYQYPYELVSELLVANADAIKEIRKIQPVLGLMQKEDFERANIQISTELIENLVKPMIY